MIQGPTVISCYPSPYCRKPMVGTMVRRGNGRLYKYAARAQLSLMRGEGLGALARLVSP